MTTTGLSGDLIVSLIALLICLFLATRALRAQHLSFERKAWMLAAWVGIIVVLTFLIQRLG